MGGYANHSQMNQALSSVANYNTSVFANSLVLKAGGGVKSTAASAFGNYYQNYDTSMNTATNILYHYIRTGGVIAEEGNAGFDVPFLTTAGVFTFWVQGENTVLE